MPKFTRDLNNLFGTIFNYNSITNIIADVDLYLESLSCQNEKKKLKALLMCIWVIFVELVFTKRNQNWLNNLTLLFMFENFFLPFFMWLKQGPIIASNVIFHVFMCVLQSFSHQFDSYLTPFNIC